MRSIGATIFGLGLAALVAADSNSRAAVGCGDPGQNPSQIFTRAQWVTELTDPQRNHQPGDKKNGCHYDNDPALSEIVKNGQWYGGVVFTNNYVKVNIYKWNSEILICDVWWTGGDNTVCTVIPGN